MKWLREAAGMLSADLSNVCRLCMAEGTECMQPIFEEFEYDGERFQLSSRIFAVTSLRPEPGDCLPAQACQHCVAQVNRWYDFKALCEASNDMLRHRLAGARSGDPGDALLLRIKEEPAEVDLWSAQTPPTPPSLDPDEEGAASNAGSASQQVLGRISTTFSLQQDVGPLLLPALLFNGDTTTAGEATGTANGLCLGSPDDPFVCALCDARFPRKALLKRHIAAHCGEPPHPCRRCDAAFEERWELVRHLRTHGRPSLGHLSLGHFGAGGGVLQPACAVCGQEVRDAAALLRHVTAHPGARRLRCPRCPRICDSALQLRFHLREHARRVRGLFRLPAPPRTLPPPPAPPTQPPLPPTPPPPPSPPPPAPTNHPPSSVPGEASEDDDDEEKQNAELSAQTTAPGARAETVPESPRASPPTISDAAAVMSSSTIMEPELEPATGDGANKSLVLLPSS